MIVFLSLMVMTSALYIVYENNKHIERLQQHCTRHDNLGLGSVKTYMFPPTIMVRLWPHLYIPEKLLQTLYINTIDVKREMKSGKHYALCTVYGVTKLLLYSYIFTDIQVVSMLFCCILLTITYQYFFIPLLHHGPNALIIAVPSQQYIEHSVTCSPMLSSLTSIIMFILTKSMHVY